jgi:acyl CoA:acetate/3-ketoacid CoA transferase beta subunit
VIVMRQDTRTFVDKLDFRTSVGFGDGPGDRERLGLRGAGPTLVVTDLGLLRPHPESCELVLTDLHPGVTVDEAQAATGWSLVVADTVGTVAPPSELELTALRVLQAPRVPAGTA